MESMQNNKQSKVENPNAERKLKRVVDNDSFQFKRPMKTGKKDIETVMIRIPITAKDINASKGEELPEGGYVRVLQMILTEETPKEEGRDSPIKFNQTSQDGKLGKEPGGIRSEHLYLMKCRDDQRNSAAANVVPPTAITTTTIVPSGASSLAAAAAAAKNDPPVVHKQIDIDVDNEIHHDDDYMPPPDTSGNKRSRKNVTNIIPTVPDP
jgi:hypothetical protein